MVSFKIILIVVLVFGILLFANQKEKYTGERKYNPHNKTDYPLNDLTGMPIVVKNDKECQKKCDEKAGTCYGYIVSVKADANKKRQCYLKTKDAFTPVNRRYSPDWNAKIEQDYYRGVKNVSSWSGAKDPTNKNCGNAEVKLYNDGTLSQGQKAYRCGDYDITTDFPGLGKDAGVSSFDVPPGLTLELWGFPKNQSLDAVYGPGGFNTAPKISSSGKLTGKASLDYNTAGLTVFGDGNWNDRVTRIQVARA